MTAASGQACNPSAGCLPRAAGIGCKCQIAGGHPPTSARCTSSGERGPVPATHRLTNAYRGVTAEEWPEVDKMTAISSYRQEGHIDVIVERSMIVPAERSALASARAEPLLREYTSPWPRLSSFCLVYLVYTVKYR